MYKIAYKLIVFVLRVALSYWLVLASSEHVDDQRVPDGFVGGSRKFGVPFPHYKVGPATNPRIDGGYTPRGRSFPDSRKTELTNTAILLSTAALSVVLSPVGPWSPLRPRPSGPPAPAPTPAVPPELAPAAPGRWHPWRRVASWLVVCLLELVGLVLLAGTVLGTLDGHGLRAGFVGWVLGKGLHDMHERRGRRPPWAATEVWVLGRAIAIATLICELGVAWYGR